MGHMEDLGRLALGSRLKRLSNELMIQTNALYKECGIDMDASCFPLLNVVAEKEPVNLRAAQNALGTSHADISQKTAILKKRGLITAVQDVEDMRAKSLALTDKGREVINKALPLWRAIDRTLAQNLHPYEDEFFRSLITLEEKLSDGSLIDEYKQDLKDRKAAEIKIVEYRPEYREKFRTINEEWLRKYFTIEDVDEQMFVDPEGTIIKGGGQIFFALLGDEVVATCALYRQYDAFEVCKMGVDPRYRGMGIAGKMLEACFDYGAKVGVKKLYLLTHSKLKSALQLYARHGFIVVPVKKADQEKYARVDVRMEREL